MKNKKLENYFFKIILTIRNNFVFFKYSYPCMNTGRKKYKISY